ncbi:MAG: cation:proton antiporter [Clostridia bacterium]|nr:cation:proton antiporter [Clostridia bacterium]
MISATALILLSGLLLGTLTRKLRLPHIIGYLAAGMLIGPYVLDLLSPAMLSVSGDIRKMALIIILMRAGFSLDVADLRRIGRPAILLCFLPATFELLAFVLFAPSLLGISRLEAALLGAVMGAVSPAVVVPRMTALMEQKRGTAKGIPQMIVAGASADDVYVIVLFSSMLSLVSGGSVRLSDFLQIPVAIVLGLLGGILVGFVVSVWFGKISMRRPVRLLIVLAIAFLLVTLEDILSGSVAFSGLLAVMSLSMTLHAREEKIAADLASQCNQLWTGAEILLFVLVGASVNIHALAGAGFSMTGMLLLGLLFRLFGTFLCVLRTPLNHRERFFCLLTETPNATVQAAIGGVPLAMGLACGDLVLTFSVLAIILTAPLGAFAIDCAAPRWLSDDSGQQT